MNYIELINRFWSIDLEANFSHLEVHLFFKLLEINNRLDWKESFRFPNSRLEAEIGSRPKNLINARQRLVDFKLIEYKKGTTREAGIYKLLSFECSFVPTKESNQESNSSQTPTKESNKGSNQGTNEKVIRGSLDKQNKTKQVSIKKEMDLSFVPTIYKPLIEEFIRYRKQDLKKPFKTANAVKIFFENLRKESNNNISKAKELVDYAKGREWMTVFPIPKKQKAPEKFRNESVVEYDNKL